VLQKPSAKRKNSNFLQNISRSDEGILNSPSTALEWGIEQVVKVGLGCENAVKANQLILWRTIVTLMIHQVYFFHLVGLTLNHSDQALRKLRIISALFVCWEARMQGGKTLFLWDRQGHLKEVFVSPTEKHLLPHSYGI